MRLNFEFWLKWRRKTDWASSSVRDKDAKISKIYFPIRFFFNLCKSVWEKMSTNSFVGRPNLKMPCENADICLYADWTVRLNFRELAYTCLVRIPWLLVMLLSQYLRNPEAIKRRDGGSTPSTLVYIHIFIILCSLWMILLSIRRDEAVLQLLVNS